MSFSTTLILMINFLGCIVLPPGVTKIFQIQKIQRFDKSVTDVSDLIIVCFIWGKSCQKLYLDNLYLLDILPIMHCSTSGVDQTHKFFF